MALQTPIPCTEPLLHTLIQQAANDDIQKLVVGAVVYKNTTVLLLRRHQEEAFLAGLVELPSGTVEQGESLLEALERELYEETGLTVTSVENYIGSFDYQSGSGKSTRQFNFSVAVNGEPRVSSEHSDFYFITPSAQALQDLDVSPETQHAILTSTHQ